MAGIEGHLKAFSGEDGRTSIEPGLRNVYRILCSYNSEEGISKILLSKDIEGLTRDKQRVRSVMLRKISGGEYPLEDAIYNMAKAEKSKFQEGNFESDPAKIVAASAYVSMLGTDEAKSLLETAKQPASLGLILLADEALTSYEGAKKAFSSVKKKSHSDAEGFCLDFFRGCALVKAGEKADAAIKEIEDAERELSMQSPSEEEKAFLMIRQAYASSAGKNDKEAEFSGKAGELASARKKLDYTAARMLEAIIAGKEKMVATAKNVLYSESGSLDERITSAGMSRELLSSADESYKRIEEMPCCSNEISARVRSRRSEISSLLGRIDGRIDFCKKIRNKCTRISGFLASSSKYEQAVLSMKEGLTEETLSIFDEMAGSAAAINSDYAAAEKNEREYLESAGYKKAASFYERACSHALEIARYRAEQLASKIEKKRTQLKSATLFNCALRGGLSDFKKRTAESIKMNADELEEALRIIRFAEAQKSAEA